MANFQDIRLTKDTHDLSIESFDLVLIDGTERVEQNLRIALWFFLTEWYLDTTIGLDYLNALAVKNPQLTKVESTLKRKILEVQDVTEITQFSLSFDARTRIMNVQFQCNTTFGLTNELTL